jgi:small subunit ribosomal protein S4
VVAVRDKSRNMALILEAIESGERDVPDYLDVDHNDMKGSYIRAPKLADVPYPVQMQPSLVIEFYSR